MSTNADNSNALAETVKQQGEVLNQLSSGLADVTKALGAISKKMDGDEGLSDETKLSDLSVGELRGVIKGETAEQMKALGWKPGDNRNLEQGGDQGTRQSPSDGQQQQQASADQGGDDGEPKNFQAVIVKLVQDGMKESDAVAFAIKNPKYHSLYEAWKKDGGTAHFMAA